MLVPEPVLGTLPGLRVRVQLPDGRLLRTTLPVETLQEGWVMVPTEGAEGVAGWGLMVTLPVGPDVHTASFLTRKL